ncbi:type I restriction enzyme M protein [Pontibacter ummariensis]|uniref:site-specific DNA-methyltransferase (adenine-specific) n=1 Tax=Pontibacter ummariensis TaxID=1610492 RepID=A0A239FV62_9BACT|nr:type I restriction-modification system subunit M [Pontibacter ummariensis]PRY11899.1 type I restriction enzyme M protein [Pontibacter ummariensis]SNS61026.1 type I restriction enzyme M protein [Pontibacter ummariensis]
MTNEQLKKLEDDLWDAANSLRAYGGIKASDYAVPVLGLIFLRFADNKYSHVEAEILQEYEKYKGTRMERALDKIALEKCGFYLPENARYDYLLNLPGDKKAAEAIKEAMVAIESYQDAKFQGVLPKDAFFDIEKKKDDILPQLLKAFSDIPKDASGDVFGKIYEYFLGNFALSEGQKGGEFFTPTSVVRFIVEVIEPYSGKIYDPACGSGGMFVQSAKFVKEANHDLNDIYVCGQEYMGETVRLAKMNLLVNNLRGEITETNSYESDPYNSKGKFDYVMANPPFNVKTVKEATVKNDPRFTAYGLPTNKGKKDDKITDANYLWVSLFASSLNDKGRAGFVMANSASDARNSEYEIRKNIVDSGIVDCMVTMPSNMFYTVTLPATIWFFDKGKVNTDRKNKILFLDGRNVYRQMDRAHREWTEEQVQNLSAVVRLYRGETDRYLELISHYIKEAQAALTAIPERVEKYKGTLDNTLAALKSYYQQSKDKYKPEQLKKLKVAGLPEQLQTLQLKEGLELPNLQPLQTLIASAKDNASQLQFAAELKTVLAAFKELQSELNKEKESMLELWEQADSLLKIKSDKGWNDLELNKIDKALDKKQQKLKIALEQAIYWLDNMTWLHESFPEAKYVDVTGLCKAASRKEYVEEQDYSLNAGRYVGITFENETVSAEEFKMTLSDNYEMFKTLSEKARDLEEQIHFNIGGLL